jgi:hypothetical protein
VEVNEGAHYDSDEQINADKVRKCDIELRTGHVLFVVDCRKSLLEIHNDVDLIVEQINAKVLDLKQRNVFEPWDPDRKQSPDYWKAKEVIRVSDGVSLSNIEAICGLFGADFRKTKRGFLRLGGLPHPQKKNVLLWWPSENTRQGWQNRLVENETAIRETHERPEKRRAEYETYKDSPQIRYVFFHLQRRSWHNELSI